MSKINRLRISKLFRSTRPTASRPGQRRSGWLEPDALALAAGMVIATVAPLGSADDITRAWALAAVAGAAPSERVVLLTVAPEDLRGGSCERALPGVLDRGHARAALVLEPADGLCGIKEGKGGAPVVALPLDDLRLRGTTVVGFEATSARSLGALGISSSPWVVPRAARSVPAVALRDLESGAVPACAVSPVRSRTRKSPARVKRSRWRSTTG